MEWQGHERSWKKKHFEILIIINQLQEVMGRKMSYKK